MVIALGGQLHPHGCGRGHVLCELHQGVLASIQVLIHPRNVGRGLHLGLGVDDPTCSAEFIHEQAGFQPKAFPVGRDQQDIVNVPDEDHLPRKVKGEVGRKQGHCG